jgi:hypothetical protein
MANLLASFGASHCRMPWRSADSGGIEPVSVGKSGFPNWCEFCSWQAGCSRLDNSPPDVLALAGAFVLAFRKPIRQEIIPFRKSAWIVRKEGGSVVLAGVRQGLSGVPDDLDPVRDCRRPRRSVSFFKGLIEWPA